MKYKTRFALGLLISITLSIGSIILLLNYATTGIAIILFSSIIAIPTYTKVKDFTFEDYFLAAASLIALTTTLYALMNGLPKNLVIITSAFFALNFLIQAMKTETKKIKKIKIKTYTNNKDEKTEVKTKTKKETTNTETKINYYHTKSGKCFHQAGCIALSKTKPETLIKNSNREELLAKGYKTCKACNS